MCMYISTLHLYLSHKNLFLHNLFKHFKMKERYLVQKFWLKEIHERQMLRLF